MLCYSSSITIYQSQQWLFWDDRFSSSSSSSSCRNSFLMSCQTLDLAHPELVASDSVNETPRASGTVSGFPSCKCFKSFRGFTGFRSGCTMSPLHQSHRIVISNKHALTVTCTCLIHMHKCWLELCATASSTRLIYFVFNTCCRGKVFFMLC